MLNINSIQKLEDVERNAVKKITVAVPVRVVDKEFCEDFAKVVDANKGHISLCVNIYSGSVAQRMISRTKRVKLSREFVAFLEENNLKYTLS
jgi:hypothetical protein